MSKFTVCPVCLLPGTKELYTSHGRYYARINHWDPLTETTIRHHIPTLRVSE